MVGKQPVYILGANCVESFAYRRATAGLPKVAILHGLFLKSLHVT